MVNFLPASGWVTLKQGLLAAYTAFCEPKNMPADRIATEVKRKILGVAGSTESVM